MLIHGAGAPNLKELCGMQWKQISPTPSFPCVGASSRRQGTMTLRLPCSVVPHTKHTTRLIRAWLSALVAIGHFEFPIMAAPPDLYRKFPSYHGGDIDADIGHSKLRCPGIGTQHMEGELGDPFRNCHSSHHALTDGQDGRGQDTLRQIRTDKSHQLQQG